MAKLELRKPIDTLLKTKAELEKQMTVISDTYTALHEKLVSLRHDQFCNKEAKQSLPNLSQHKPARNVFDKSIADAQLEVDKVSKELEEVEKNRVVIGSKLKAMDSSIKELQRA